MTLTYKDTCQIKPLKWYKRYGLLRADCAFGYFEIEPSELSQKERREYGEFKYNCQLLNSDNGENDREWYEGPADTIKEAKKNADNYYLKLLSGYLKKDLKTPKIVPLEWIAGGRVNRSCSILTAWCPFGNFEIEFEESADGSEEEPKYSCQLLNSDNGENDYEWYGSANTMEEAKINAEKYYLELSKETLKDLTK